MIDLILITYVDNSKRLRLFEQTISSLFEHTDLVKYVNRIVWVDDNSPFFDDWDKYVPLFMKNNNVVIERNVKQMGVGYSKNKGVQISKMLGADRLMYMFDSDVYFTEGWLDRLVQVYENNKHEFKLIGGGVHPYLQKRQGEGNSDITSHDAISGWSWLLSYDTWDKYGTLSDNAIGTGKSEDWEYCQRIRNDGFKVGCVQPQVIAHCGLTNTEGLPIVGYEESKRLAQSVAPKALLI